METMVKRKKHKKGKLREMAKKQFRFWTNIKYCVPCQHVNFISYREASSGRRKWRRVACSSPKLTETRTNQPFELLSIRESELQLELFAHNCNLISHAKLLHSAHTVYLCIPYYSFRRDLFFWTESTEPVFVRDRQCVFFCKTTNFKIN
jgi:hypothetical protein